MAQLPISSDELLPRQFVWRSSPKTFAASSFLVFECKSAIGGVGRALGQLQDRQDGLAASSQTAIHKVLVLNGEWFEELPSPDVHVVTTCFSLLEALQGDHVLAGFRLMRSLQEQNPESNGVPIDVAPGSLGRSDPLESSALDMAIAESPVGAPHGEGEDQVSTDSLQSSRDHRESDHARSSAATTRIRWRDNSRERWYVDRRSFLWYVDRR